MDMTLLMSQVTNMSILNTVRLRSVRRVRLLSRYPWAVLATSGLLSLLSILCSLTLHTLPDFTDPQEVSIV